MDWTHRLRLRNLQMLLSLAQTGNMSQSAELLHTTQPGLSKWLRELEEDVGVPLFERLARGLRPTVYGEALIGHARRIEAHLDTARDEMAVLRDGGDGLVSIGFAGASSVDSVPMAVLKILEKLPTAHIRLMESKAENLLESLSMGLLDVVVGPSNMHVQDPLIRSEVLYVEPIHLVVRRDHPILDLRKPTWADVLSYPWALWAKGTPVRTAFDKALIEAGQKPPVAYVESNSATLTTTLLVHSNMIGVTSGRPALRWTRMNILSIIPIQLTVSGSVTLYWRDDLASRVAVKAALDGIRQVVQEFSKDGDSKGTLPLEKKPRAKARVRS
ncbi:MAG: putative transcriptional regulator [Rhodoferax sp.]|nr:putative transcriptional regulator [Rhodoferax sp.]